MKDNLKENYWFIEAVILSDRKGKPKPRFNYH